MSRKLYPPDWVKKNKKKVQEIVAVEVADVEAKARGLRGGAVDEVCEEGRRILRGGGGFCEVEEAGEEAEEVHIAPAGVAK